MSRAVRVDAPVAADLLFGYLTDPRRRPDWQASLRAVTHLRGNGEPGSSWTDVTAVGARPEMTVSASHPPRRWEECGRWHGLSAVLRLELLAYAPDRTRLTATFTITGVGVFALVAAVLERFAGPAIAADLRRAVRLAAAG